MKLAIVLFTLGAPDRPENVRPFLFNLFNDKAIIGAPQPIRWLLAQLISRRRAPVARGIYEEMGGGSPLLANTEAQGAALEKAVPDVLPKVEAKTFVAMRYWHPMSDETARAVKAWGPDRVLLLPLYPQFSTTTTGSSVADWNRAARSAGLSVPSRAICCYPVEPGFIAASAADVRAAVKAAGGKDKVRLLYSAHGLPEKIVKAGDPYQWQVERTAAAIDAALEDGPESVICYQSRVGPLKWIGPSTDEEIERAGRDGKAVVLAPIAFVSEHSETLVELDIEYRKLAEECGVPGYHRVPTVSTSARFIEGLAALVKEALETDGICPADGVRICAPVWSGCPCRAGGSAP